MSLKDRVAVIGAGCTKFGENFDMSYDDMVVEATYQAYEDAGVGPEDIQAAWLGTCFPEVMDGKASGVAAADPLRLYPKPVTRVENQCATGMDAFRNACLAVASGVYDVALVVGAEKMRDVAPRDSLVARIVETGHPLIAKGITAPGIFALSATRYFHRFGIGREHLAQVAVKNHYHGSLNPRAHFQREVTAEQVLGAPMICYPLGLYDCCPTTDGAASLIVTRAELAPSFTDDYVLVKGIGFATDHWFETFFNQANEFVGFRATQEAGRSAYEQAGIKDPATEIDVAEVHDCFTITEILNYEDLGLAGQGRGWHLVEEGRTRLGGDLPVNTSGGLKSCGHPIGASGARMIYDIVQQLRGRAGPRQVPDAQIGLAHNLGGPGSVSCVTILGNP